jgi:hypothetical protein
MKNNQLNPAEKAESKELYEAPVIETIEVRVEQGFQLTGGGTGSGNESEDLSTPGGKGSW